MPRHCCETESLKMPVDHPDRMLPFTGAFNFRDLGGYPTNDDRHIKWRTLFRADALHRLPDEELDQLAEIGMRSVLDLRTKGEVDNGHLVDGTRGIRHFHFPVLNERWERKELDPNAPADQVLGSLYVEMLDVGANALRDSVQTVANAENIPAVFHCAAGKDRTGVLAAMIMTLVGVDRELIIADYAISGRNMDSLVERLKKDSPESLSSMNDQPKAYLAAPPAAMRHLLEHIDTRYGSVRAYCAEIGIDDETVSQLKETILAPNA